LASAIIQNILRSGHTFTIDEFELEMKYIVSNMALLAVSFTLLLSSITFYLNNNIVHLVTYIIGTFLGFIGIYMGRIVPKNSLNMLVYFFSTFFLILLFYAYYKSPNIEAISAWVIVQLITSLMLLNASIGILISLVFTVFLIWVNIHMLNYELVHFILIKVIPVYLVLVLVYLFEKKFRYLITELKNSNILLEEKVRERTSEVENEKEALYIQAHYDFLTNLPNRNMIYKKLKKMVDTDLDMNKKFAILFIDLDRFKHVNDSFGHSTGDELLQIIAKRLLNIIPKKSFLGRNGGDEFILLIDKKGEKNNIRKTIKSILKTIESAVQIEDKKLYVSASIGVSRYPNDSVDYKDLLKYADTAMFESKKIKRGGYRFYHEDMTNNLKNTTIMGSEIFSAIEEDKFVCYYQPQVHIKSNKITGMELLARWNTEDKGFIPAEKFISCAEDTGAIFALDYYILEKGMKQIVLWKKNNIEIPKISFNFSTKHLHQNNFVTFIRNLLLKTGCKGEWIELEITETHMMLNIEEVIIELKELKELGVCLAIDDFGKGYSSLTYLKNLPIDKVKIDKSFINNVHSNNVDAAIVRSIINIADSLNINTVAEGVETKEQRDYLLNEGCKNIQGYFYYKPMDVEKLEIEILRKMG